MKARFKIGDRVVRGTQTFTVTCVGPRDRQSDEEVWYGLRGGAPEMHIRPYKDAWDRELDPAELSEAA